MRSHFPGMLVRSLAVVAIAVIPVGAASGQTLQPYEDAENRFRDGPTPGVGKIIGGTDATIADNSWQVGLLASWIADDASAQFCGGSLVRPGWVVTAAHCVAGRTADQIHVLSGTAKLGQGGMRGNITRIYAHKDYAGPPTYDNDIALLELRRDRSEGTITPVSLSEESGIVVAGEDAKISGWGVTDSGGSSTQLKEVLVPLVSRTKCNAPGSYDGRISENMICAGIDAGGRDSCQGDSGGPNTRGGRLIGVVSWGEGCAEPFKYGVYTRVAKFASWIGACIQDSTSCPTL